MLALKIAYYILGGMLCAAAAGGIVVHTQRKRRTDTVYSMTDFGFTAVSSLLLGGAIIVLTATGWAAAVWPLAAVGVFALSAWAVWFAGGIVFDAEGFTLRRRFFSRKHYRYAEVSGLRTVRRKRRRTEEVTVYLYVYGERIPLDPQAHNYTRFVDAMDAGYRAAHDGEPLPALKQ